MKKMILIVLITTWILFAVGCNGKPSDEILAESPAKLVKLDEYSAMTMDGTTSIEVVYDYVEGEFTTYQFVIDHPETIKKIMTEVFNMELKDYPDDQDIDFYQRWMIVHQGSHEYYVGLAYASDENGNLYLCQSPKVCELIETYIEDHLIS